MWPGHHPLALETPPRTPAKAPKKRPAPIAPKLSSNLQSSGENLQRNFKKSLNFGGSFQIFLKKWQKKGKKQVETRWNKSKQDEQDDQKMKQD